MSLDGVNISERNLKFARMFSKIFCYLDCGLQEGDCVVSDIFRDCRKEIFGDLVYTSRGLFLSVKEDD